MSGNIFNDDFRDFIQCLNIHNVEYILVDGYSVIIHGYPRTTGDMDLWVNRTSENYDRICMSFQSFGMPLFDMTKQKFLDSELEVFRFGLPPSRIDLMTTVKGLSFDETFKHALTFDDYGLIVKVVHINDLIFAKKASGRPRDLDDIENLENKNPNKRN